MPSRALFCLAIGFMGPTVWAEGPSEKPENRGYWVISNGIGGSSTQNSDVRIRQGSTNTNLLYRNVSWASEADQNPPIYNFRAMYWKSPASKVGYGFEFVHNKMLAKTGRTVSVSGTLNGSAYNQTEPMNVTLPQFSVTNGLNLFHGVVQFREFLGKSGDRPQGLGHAYGGVGMGVAIPHPVTRFNGGPSSGQYQFGGFSWHVFVGYEHRIAQRLGLYVEGKYMDYQVDADMANGASGETRAKSTMIVVGISYRL